MSPFIGSAMQRGQPLKPHTNKQQRDPTGFIYMNVTKINRVKGYPELEH